MKLLFKDGIPVVPPSFPIGIPLGLFIWDSTCQHSLVFFPELRGDYLINATIFMILDIVTL